MVSHIELEFSTTKRQVGRTSFPTKLARTVSFTNLALGSNDFIIDWLDGKCLDKSGSEQTKNRLKKHPQLNADECLAECKGWDDATGCLFKQGGGCWIHTADVASASGEAQYKCSVFPG